MQLTQYLQPKTPIPHEHRRNFFHLYADIAWFGLQNGSFIAFSAVYLTKIGASTQQLGWFSAIPALVTLFLALPAGYWLKSQKLDRAVFWSAAIYRLYFVAILLVISFLPTAVQVNIILGLTLLISGPGTLLAIGFNSLFANLVPSEWRSHVIGIRHALLAIASILASLGCGYLLNNLPFLLGYQIVFGLGVLGAAMSTLHLWFLKDSTPVEARNQQTVHLKEPAKPGIFPVAGWVRPPLGLRYLPQRTHLRIPRTDILRGDFGRAMIVLGFLFFALYVANPLYHPYWVGELGYSEQLLSYGTALFYILQFVAASQLGRITDWLGNHKSLAVGAVLLAAYPGVTALSAHPAAFLLSSAMAGTGWGVAGGAMLAYLLDLVPTDERPRYMAWYSLLTNAAILVGSLTGPLIGDLVGVRYGLGVAAFFRFSSGILVLLVGGAVPIWQRRQQTAQQRKGN